MLRELQFLRVQSDSALSGVFSGSHQYFESVKKGFTSCQDFALPYLSKQSKIALNPVTDEDMAAWKRELAALKKK